MFGRGEGRTVGWRVSFDNVALKSVRARQRQPSIHGMRVSIPSIGRQEMEITFDQTMSQCLIRKRPHKEKHGQQRIVSLAVNRHGAPD